MNGVYLSETNASRLWEAIEQLIAAGDFGEQVKAAFERAADIQGCAMLTDARVEELAATAAQEFSQTTGNDGGGKR